MRQPNGIFGIIVEPFRGLTALVLILAAMAAIAAGPVQAGTFFVAPGKSSRGDGSRHAPWRSIHAALASKRLRPGDRVVLKAGEYGRLKIAGAKFAGPVTFAAAPGGVAHFTDIEVVNSRNLVFDGLSVWPKRPLGDQRSVIRTAPGAVAIVFRNLDVRAVRRAGDYVHWSKRDWLRNRASGLLLRGPRNVVRDSVLTGMNFAIATTGDDSRVLNNRIFGFSGDGIRVLGDRSEVSGNLIADCVKIDGNHDDGIQSWTLGPNGKPGGGTQDGLVVENNRIFEWTGPKGHPLICDLQGMLFGHHLTNLLIRNNVVSVSAYHGISAAGVNGGVIANNTLVNSRKSGEKRPWIGVLGDGKRSSRNVVVANNVAPAYRVPKKLGYGAANMHNVTLLYPNRELVAPARGDLRPKPGSRLVDRANPAYAPPFDIDGTPRPQGRRPDIGAYELR